jgi:hypothetical protein
MASRLFLMMAFVLVCLGCNDPGYVQVPQNPHPDTATWLPAHPVEYAKDPASCASCHGSTTDPANSGKQYVTGCFSCHNHSPNAACGSCHLVQQKLWASSNNLHALSAADVLTNVDHNTAELLNNNCVKCHSSFQVPLGVAHFVTPVDQIGKPAGTWAVLNSSDWQATKCEVCHDPTSTNIDKLAKYGSVLDGPWAASYTKISDLAAAYQTVIDPTGAVSTFTYSDQATLAVQATKLCNSCHDPADQGGDPNIIAGGIDYGPQGGDSRAYVTTSHQGMGCIDCHTTHDFTPVLPETTPSCGGVGCHPIKAGALPGKVHVNHL